MKCYMKIRQKYCGSGTWAFYLIGYPDLLVLCPVSIGMKNWFVLIRQRSNLEVDLWCTVLCLNGIISVWAALLFPRINFDICLFFLSIVIHHVSAKACDEGAAGKAPEVSPAYRFLSGVAGCDQLQGTGR